jgi:polar amino acid transport system substrate-binding protein
MGVNAQECSVLRAAGNTGWMPVSYINKDTNEHEGIAHDLIKIIGKRLNIPIIIDAKLPWNRMLRNLNEGIMDMSVAIYWTKERAEKYVYTESYFVNEARVFVQKGKEFPFKQFEDLIGLTGGIPSGGTFGGKFDRFAKEHHLKLEGVKTKEQRVEKLLLGRNDYFINDYLDATLYLKLNGGQEKIVALPHPVSTTKVYFAVSQKSSCVQHVSRINLIIKEAKQDGTLQAIINKYSE